MIKKAIAFLLVVFGLLGAFPAISYGQYTGVVSVDNVIAEPGGQVGVPIRLSDNNQPISGIYVPIKFDGQYLTLDSISFAGSIDAPDFTKTKNSDYSGIRISYQGNYTTSMATITATEGILATLHFSVAQNAPTTTAAIDSIYTIKDVSHNTFRWERVIASDPTGTVVLLPSFQPGAVDIQLATGIEDGKGPNLPAKFALGQNYPNPFNPSTTIEFTLPKAGQVRLEVFNILGQSVNTLIDRAMEAGSHRIDYDGSRLPSGIYFYRLTHTAGSQTRKMVLIK